MRYSEQMSIFDINSDIRKAETLSSEFYTDEKYFYESKEKIFARSWQLIGKTDEVESLKSFVILKNFLNEPILITKNDLEIHCLSNVCTHRGNILVENECKATGIRCSYHGRRFDLEGKFLSMPEFENVENFPSEGDNLQKIPFGIWEDFMFASIAPVAPFELFFGEMRSRLRSFDFKNLKFFSTKDYEVKAHWALYCENYLEGFHVPFVHKTLNEVIDFGSYKTETFRYSSLQTALSEPTALAVGKTVEPNMLFEDQEIAAYYFFIFPNTMFNFYPWGISINIVKPISKCLTKVSYLTYVNDETKLDKGAGADLETVEFEDQNIVENVQKGIRSRFYDRGRYSPSREQGTHHFHHLIAEFMNL
jgi:choline monooxygenase